MAAVRNVGVGRTPVVEEEAATVAASRVAAPGPPRAVMVVSSFAALPHCAKLLPGACWSVFCGRARARLSSWQPQMTVLWRARTHCGCTCTRAAVLTRRCCLHALLLDGINDPKTRARVQAKACRKHGEGAEEHVAPDGWDAEAYAYFQSA